MITMDNLEIAIRGDNLTRTVTMMRELSRQAAMGNDVHRAERELRWLFDALDETLTTGAPLPSQWEHNGGPGAAQSRLEALITERYEAATDSDDTR